MNLPHSVLRSLFLPALLLGTLRGTATAADPAWWTASGAVTANPKDDYAKVNLGQLKNMAAKARLELNNLPGGAGATIDALVNGWSNTAGADDYAVCNLGQLKAVAKPYWDRLIATGYATAGEIPWTAVTTDDDDHSLANIGQLKTAFTVGLDRDNDGFPDNWEIATAGSITVLNGNGQSDADGDGISDLAEYQMGWSPVVNDLNDATKTESLTYDAAHRLTAVSGRSTLGYTLDANANLLQKTP